MWLRCGRSSASCAIGPFIRLLDEHFQKEEEILFPMAREVLDTGELEEVARAMEAL